MDQTLIYILIILMTAVILLALAVVVMYIRVTRKYVNLRTAGVGDKDETIIGNAKAIAEKILEDAKNKSKLMIDHGEVVSGKYADILEKQTQDAANKYLDNFTKTLQGSENQMLGSIAQISGGVGNVINQDITNMRLSLAGQLQKMQQDVTAEIQKTYENLETDLTSYKEMRFKQIDAAIFDIVEQVARKVLAKEISADEHEKLVMKALDEAKRQNVFFSDVKTNGNNDPNKSE